ncbi:hypothetical protein GUJ93_ZPchr0002g26764 [Zizania palustris]|uniref:RING-type domain-containing protein n=1 Tax=Zizania palustris TaxID=103762 RepID=A0A8J5VRJ4_ZIZPA|nr:hypothetical protein GUJ93_ZPchr0002g26764 [Zizania palustris]
MRRQTMRERDDKTKVVEYELARLATPLKYAAPAVGAIQLRSPGWLPSRPCCCVRIRCGILASTFCNLYLIRVLKTEVTLACHACTPCSSSIFRRLGELKETCAIERIESAPKLAAAPVLDVSFAAAYGGERAGGRLDRSEPALLRSIWTTPTGRNPVQAGLGQIILLLVEQLLKGWHSAEHLAAALATTQAPAAAASGGGGVHTDTFVILAAVLCFLLCVVGLAVVARCSRLCNPSAFAVEAEPAEAMPPAAAPCKGLKKKALQSLPTVSFEVAEPAAAGEEERPECAICLAEFARGDEVRVLPPCGHGFHAACVDVWLLSSSTCPSCRRALVLVAPSPATATEPPPCCACADAAQASAQSQSTVAGERGGCRTSSVP